MKLLEKEFICNADSTGNHTFRQLRKDNGVAMYERIRPDNSHFGYEVFVIKTVKAGKKLPGGKVVTEDYERYPGAHVWGKTAWSPKTLGEAEAKFDELVAMVKSEAGQPKRRGRKSKKINLVLPKGEFTMKMLIAETGLTQPVLYVRLQKMIRDGTVKEVGRQKSETGRGKAAVVYQTV